MPRKRSAFGCFGSRPGHHPEIRYGLDSGQGMHVLREFSLPMPEESELNAKFAELVVSLNRIVFPSHNSSLRKQFQVVDLCRCLGEYNATEVVEVCQNLAGSGETTILVYQRSETHNTM